MKEWMCILFILPALNTVTTPEQTATIGSKVNQVEVRDSKNRPVRLPYFGEKHLLIFYPDPDHASQNQEFTDYLEEHQIDSEHIYAFGIANLKDAPFMPDKVIRYAIRNKERKTGAKIYTDPDHILRDAWGLGDVNNLFTIIFITRKKEIAFLKKGKMTEDDIKEFYQVIERYK